MEISYNQNITPHYQGFSKRSFERVSDNGNISFNGRIFQSAEKLADTLVKHPAIQKNLTSRWFNNFLKTATEKPGIFEALIALGITCTARPLSILCIPGAKMEDKKYASAQAISSGLVGLGSAYLAFDPISKALDNAIKDVNSKNITETFKFFYANPKNADTIAKLVDNKIIPSKTDFDKLLLSTKNIFKDMKDYMINNGSKAAKEALVGAEDSIERTQWLNLSADFSKALSSAYKSVKQKNIGVIDGNKKYLLHDMFSFAPDCKYALKTSVGADKAKYIIGFTSKMVLFPLLALSTIWAIPKIMKLVFPNHKKSKGVSKEPVLTGYNNLNSKEFMKNNAVYKQFVESPVNNKAKTQQVAFAGAVNANIAKKGLSSVTGALNSVYQKLYYEPFSNLLQKVYDRILYSKSFSKYMSKLLQKDEIQKYGLKTLSRDSVSGKILNKFDNNFFVSNLANIVAVWGSGLYILNTIRNKEIEKDRKPALCTNMALVAVFSLAASKGLEKLCKPFFDALKKKHVSLMRNRLAYDAEGAWKFAYKLLVSTVAFRYLGPVMATPIADKIVKAFNKYSDVKTEKTAGVTK